MGESHYACHPHDLGPWHPPTAAMVEMWVTESSDLLSTTQPLTLQSLTRQAILSCSHVSSCQCVDRPPRLAGLLDGILVSFLLL